MTATAPGVVPSGRCGIERRQLIRRIGELQRREPRSQGSWLSHAASILRRAAGAGCDLMRKGWTREG